MINRKHIDKDDICERDLQSIIMKAMKTLVTAKDQSKKDLKVIKKIHRRINSLVEEIDISKV